MAAFQECFSDIEFLYPCDDVQRLCAEYSLCQSERKTEYETYFENIRIYQFGKSTMPDQLDQTWVNCLNPFDAEYSVLRLKQFCR